jgi:hypothetical protein
VKIFKFGYGAIHIYKIVWYKTQLYKNGMFDEIDWLCLENIAVFIYCKFNLLKKNLLGLAFWHPPCYPYRANDDGMSRPLWRRAPETRSLMEIKESVP